MGELDTESDSMNRNSSIGLSLIFLPLVFGCAESRPAPTLVIDANGSAFKFIDHNAKVVSIANDLAEVESVLKDPLVSRLIKNDRVVIRCKSSDEDKVLELTAVVFNTGVNIEFEFTTGK